jgi:hypothetical protein
VLLFVLFSLAVAMVSEALRKALEHAVAAERAKDLMMHELNHRIRNNLAMVASVLELQMCVRNGTHRRSRRLPPLSHGSTSLPTPTTISCRGTAIPPST